MSNPVMEKDVQTLFSLDHAHMLHNRDSSSTICVFKIFHTPETYAVAVLADKPRGSAGKPDALRHILRYSRPLQYQYFQTEACFMSYLRFFLDSEKCMACRVRVADCRLGVCSTCYLRMPHELKAVVQCAICLEEEAKYRMVSPKCCGQRQHFHLECIKRALSRSSACPICRQTYAGEVAALGNHI